MESFLFGTSLDFAQQSPFLHQSDIYLEDYETPLASEGKKWFDQSESDMDDDHLRSEIEERPKITSPIRKTPIQKRPRKRRGQKGHDSTKWTDDDHQKYLDFYEENKDKYSFERKANRKKREHIFIEMSLYIGTKKPNQCKTHDQKYRQKLFKQQTPVELSPESTSIRLQNVIQMRNDSDSIDDCFEASYKIDESTVSTDLSPSKSFYDVDKYFSLSSPYSHEINPISNFETQEIQDVQKIPEKTWNTLIQGDSSNHALHIEIWSKMLDLAQSIPIN